MRSTGTATITTTAALPAPDLRRRRAFCVFSLTEAGIACDLAAPPLGAVTMTLLSVRLSRPAPLGQDRVTMTFFRAKANRHLRIA